MINQLKVEFYKFIRSPFFWIAMIFMCAVGIYNGYKWDIQAHITEIMTPFEEAVPDLSFAFMLSLFASWFIGGCFGNRTIHHEITSGSSRLSVILSRFFPVVLSGVAMQSAYVVATVLTLGCRIGFDTFRPGTEEMLWIGTVFLQMIALECFFLFVNFLCCNLYTGLIVSTIAAFTSINVFRNIFRTAKWYQVSFFHFAETMDPGTLMTSSVVAVISIAALMVLTFLVFRKREI